MAGEDFSRFMNEETGEWDVPYLIIHSNYTRAKQFGYGYQFSDGKFPNTSEYPESLRGKTVTIDNDNCVPGRDFDTGSIRPILEQIRDVGPSEYRGMATKSHFGGNPAFCIRLTVKKFDRATDGTASIIISNAYIRRLPNSHVPDNASGMWASSSYYYWNSKAGSWSNIGTVSAWEGSGKYNGEGRIRMWFSCGFKVHGELFVVNDPDITSEQYCRRLDSAELIDHPATGSYGKVDPPAVWADGYGGQGIINGNRILSGKLEADDRQRRIVLAIIMQSWCTCDQSGVKRPVFLADITDFMPPIAPYVWRRFGKNSTEDPEGARINSDKLDGKWHLVRPFYIPKTVKGIKGWHSVEEEITEDNP